MFNVLLESRAARQRRTGSATISALLHGGLIAGAVALTLARPTTGRANDQTPVKPPVFVHVPTATRHASSPAQPTRTHCCAPPTPLTFNPVDVNVPPSVDVAVPVIDESATFARNGSALGHGVVDVVGGDASGGLGGVIGEHAVDRAPSLSGAAQPPRYPTLLKDSGVEGRVVVEFVVDTLGRAELDEVRIVSTSHALFAQAVRDALPRYRFTPGELSGRKVRTRVQLPFDFTLTR